MSKTNLAVAIETTDELIRRYNESVCNILADPQVLAYILRHTMHEFEGWDIESVIATIEDIEVRKQYVNPGYSNIGKVVGDQTVDLIPGEGEIQYDIRFTTNIGERIRILINVEAQNKSKYYKLEYHIENRIQYYLARMISAQKNVEFFGDDYDNIRKVVSIWICMDANINCDGITKVAFKPETMYGKEVEYSEFDKLEAYIIRIRKSENGKESKNKLIHMLETLLSQKKKNEVKRILRDEHGMVMETTETASTAKGVNEMCNFGEVLYEEAVEEGIEKGIDAKLIDLISKKLKKGKDITTIADEIEEPEERVIELMEKAGLLQKN